MLLRAFAHAEAANPDGRTESVEFTDAIKAVFETVGMAKVSMSGRGSARLRFPDGRGPNHDEPGASGGRRQARALELAHSGYRPPLVRKDIPAPGESILALLKLGIHLMRQAEYISDHDQKIGIKIAEVLSRRQHHAGYSRQRAVFPGSGTGRVQVALRRAQNPGAHSIHAQDRKTATELAIVRFGSVVSEN